MSQYLCDLVLPHACSVWRLRFSASAISAPNPVARGRMAGWNAFFGTLKHKLDQIIISGSDELADLLLAFGFWYNTIRPHQHLDNRTPLEVWNGVDISSRKPRAIGWFSAWDGMLTGYHIRR